MKDILKVAGGAIVGIAIFLMGVGTSLQDEPALGSITERDCTVTHSVAAVGNDISSTLLSASSRRAWAVIQQPVNATNTVSISFGGTAVDQQGYILADIASTTGHADEIFFGLNADLPSTVAIAGITNVGSSTVNVTECNY